MRARCHFESFSCFRSLCGAPVYSACSLLLSAAFSDLAPTAGRWASCNLATLFSSSTFMASARLSACCIAATCFCSSALLVASNPNSVRSISSSTNGATALTRGATCSLKASVKGTGGGRGAIERGSKKAPPPGAAPGIDKEDWGSLSPRSRALSFPVPERTAFADPVLGAACAGAASDFADADRLLPPYRRFFSLTCHMFSRMTRASNPSCGRGAYQSKIAEQQNTFLRSIIPRARACITVAAASCAPCILTP